MKLHQLRYLCQIVDCGLNVTAAAQSLFTSQSGLSRQVRLLEREFGVELLLRQRNRIVGLTEAGKEVVAAAKKVLSGASDLKEIATSHSERGGGRLVVATSHLHARYSLQPTIVAFCKKYTKVRLKLFQLFPADIAELVAAGDADIGVTPEPELPDKRIVKLPAYSTPMNLVTPAKHPLLRLKRPTLADIARYPLILLDSQLNSGRTVARTFQEQGITPNVLMTAMNSDVVKSYVASGLGVSFLRTMPFQPPDDVVLRSISVDHLFPPSTTYILIRRDSHLKTYMYEFIGMISPGWTPKRINAAITKS
jgi:LysR family cys regulon transcriptional activator